MCELLGLNFSHPVRCSPSFGGFSRRSEDNPHGWGIARFEDRACQVFKEPVKALDSKLAHFLRAYEPFVSKTFIGHVRKATRGELSLQNTHPFVRNLFGREVAFAHNGTVEPVMAESELKFHPVGDTDSEYCFCALLTRLAERRIPFSDFEQIESILGEFNQFGTMNILFSEGERLYCYRDQHGHKGLCRIERSAPSAKTPIRDEDWEIDCGQGATEGQRGCIVATRPLTDEKWEDLRCGRLLVIEDGQAVYMGGS